MFYSKKEAEMKDNIKENERISRRAAAGQQGKLHFRKVKYAAVTLRLKFVLTVQEIKSFSFRQCLLKEGLCQLPTGRRNSCPKHCFSPAQDWQSNDNTQSKQIARKITEEGNSFFMSKRREHPVFWVILLYL